MTRVGQVLAAMLVGATFAAGAAAADDRPDVTAEGLGIVSRHTAVFAAPPKRVPTNKTPDGPLLGNGDVGVVLGGPAARQTFYIGKNDFWSRSGRCVMTVGGLVLDIPALADASYRQEQDLLRAEVRGQFAAKGLTVQTRSWVQADENLLVTEITASARAPVAARLTPFVGPDRARPASPIRENGKAIHIGREDHGQGRWYFHGLLDEVRIYDRGLSAEEVRSLHAGLDVRGGLVRHWTFDEGQGAAAKDAAGKTAGKIAAPDWAPGKSGQALKLDGRRTFVDAGPLQVKKGVTLAAWIRPTGPVPETIAYILSKGDWNHAYSLGLSNGKLRMAVGEHFAQTPASLAADRWQHVAGTFDGRRVRVFVDGAEVKSASPDGHAADQGRAGSLAWFTRSADPASVAGRRTVGLALRVLGAQIGGGDSDNDGQAITLQLPPGQKVTVISAILSDLDAKDPLSAAKKRVTQINPADVEALSGRHRQWWEGFWGRSFLEIPDKLIEKHWYGALYIMGSCSRAGKVPPGLFGNWITTDRPAWHGDFHLNYNHEAPFWGLYAANHVDTAASYETPIMEFLPQAKKNAKDLLKCRGVYYPVGIGPWGIASGNVFLGQKSNAAYATTNMIMRFYLTYDTDYARKIAYPFLVEAGSFWEDYLKWEPTADGEGKGRYVIYNDAIHENHTPHDVNPLLSLGLLRTLFRALLDTSEELGADAPRRAKWKHILDHLSEYPLQQRDGKTVFRYSEKGQAWFSSNTLGIQHIFPAGAIGLDSDPKLLTICRDTVTMLNRWTDYNGFATFYTAAARVGYDPGKILKELHGQCERHAYPNLHIFHGGGGVEECSGITLAPIEMLLQSHEGVLRLFPCWPRNAKARFGGIRARGAFLVAGEIKGGTIGRVSVTSELGRDCTVQNPWPGRSVRLTRNGKPAESVEGPRFTFKTARKETVLLAPEQAPKAKGR